MRNHTTHHDDCGCLTARYEARIATLDAMNRAHASAYAKEIDRQEARIAALEASLGECVTRAAGMIGTDAEMAAGPNHGVVLAALDWLHGQKATLEAELAASRMDAEQGWREAHMMVATANALRDALEDVLNNATCACYEDGEPGHCPRCAVAYQEARTALAQTPAASLAAHDAEVLERAAVVCDEVEFDAGDEDEIVEAQGARKCAYRIRALATQAATHSVPDGTSEVKP